ncbi:MAG: hypothetical protein M1826_007197 [Phylliscum demangeonii]|nr:MAG: hypothetical protein M1826_007197 [Phylliscum demangeonii]
MAIRHDELSSPDLPDTLDRIGRQETPILCEVETFDLPSSDLGPFPHAMDVIERASSSIDGELTPDTTIVVTLLPRGRGHNEHSLVDEEDRQSQLQVERVPGPLVRFDHPAGLSQERF